MPRRGKQNDMDLVDAVCNALHVKDDVRRGLHDHLHEFYGNSTKGMKFQELFEIGKDYLDAHYSQAREDRRVAREEAERGGASGASKGNTRRSRRDHTPGEFRGPLY